MNLPVTSENHVPRVISGPFLGGGAPVKFLLNGFITPRRILDFFESKDALFSALSGSLFLSVTPLFWLVCDPPPSAKSSLHVCAPQKIDPPDRARQYISDLNLQYQKKCEINTDNVESFNRINN